MFKRVIGLVALGLLTATLVWSCNKAAEEGAGDQTKSAAEKMAGDAKTAAENATAKPYPLDTCIISGKKLGDMGTAITKVYDGQEVKFCCPDCVPEFEKDKEKYLGEIAKAK